MLDPWHPTKLPRIEDALSIFGISPLRFDDEFSRLIQEE